MGRPFVAGNWKMNTTVHQAGFLAAAIRNNLEDITGVEVVLCPPSISLSEVAHALKGANIRVGAQNMHHEDKGAFTGEISPRMIQGLCRYVILGHSERRRDFGETDDLVSRKANKALSCNLRPIICVGEGLEARKEGRAGEVVSRSLAGSLAGIKSLKGVVVAYEPIWAIGTGEAATGEQAQEMCRLVRRELANLFGEDAAERVSVLYGGSVSPDNIKEFVSQPDIDGALVGGASLSSDQFVEIVRSTAHERSAH